jgi:hypothetical protein
MQDGEADAGEDILAEEQKVIEVLYSVIHIPFPPLHSKNDHTSSRILLRVKKTVSKTRMLLRLTTTRTLLLLLWFWYKATNGLLVQSDDEDEPDDDPSGEVTIDEALF